MFLWKLWKKKEAYLIGGFMKNKTYKEIRTEIARAIIRPEYGEVLTQDIYQDLDYLCDYAYKVYWYGLYKYKWEFKESYFCYDFIFRAMTDKQRELDKYEYWAGIKMLFSRYYKPHSDLNSKSIHFGF